MFSSRAPQSLSGADRADAVDAIAGDVEKATETSLKEAYDALAASAADDAAGWRQSADRFLATCTDLGWELPEG